MSQMAPAELADWDARRMALVLRDVGGVGEPIGTGWMACDSPGSWARYAAGVGRGEPVDGAALDRLVVFYRERGRPPRIQVTPYQHPTLLKGLAERGFSADEFESYLWCAIDGPETLEVPPELTFEPVDPESHTNVQAFCASQRRGFFGDEVPPRGMFPITERVAKLDRVQAWLIRWADKVVGSGGLETFEEGGVLIAGCVYPEVRRQGIQSTFIRFRRQWARERGLRFVTIGSVAGGPTERNALRAGFAPSFTQLVLQQQGSS